MFCISYSLISWKKLQSWFFRSIICCVEWGPHVVMVCFWRHFKNEGNVPHAVALRWGDGYTVQPFLNVSSSFSLNTELRGKWVRNVVFRKQIKDCGASLLPMVVAWRAGLLGTVACLPYFSRRKPCIVTEKRRGQSAHLLRVADRGPWGC